MTAAYVHTTSAAQRRANRAWEKRNPEAVAVIARRKHLKSKFGITLEDYEQMVVDQDGKCAICRTDAPGGAGAWHIDHNHDTGVVRGLLCFNCNSGIGKLNDDPILLLAAVAYLTREQK